MQLQKCPSLVAYVGKVLTDNFDKDLIDSKNFNKV